MNTAVICFTSAGYIVDNGYGKRLLDGKSWKSLAEAKKACEDNNITYVVA